MNKVEYKKSIAFHPGYYLKEMMEYEGMSNTDLAQHLHMSEQSISEFFNGEINITDDMAMQLSNTFGTSVSIWLNLNENYINKVQEMTNAHPS